MKRLGLTTKQIPNGHLPGCRDLAKWKRCFRLEGFESTGIPPDPFFQWPISFLILKFSRSLAGFGSQDLFFPCGPERFSPITRANPFCFWLPMMVPTKPARQFPDPLVPRGGWAGNVRFREKPCREGTTNDRARSNLNDVGKMRFILEVNRNNRECLQSFPADEFSQRITNAYQEFNGESCFHASCLLGKSGPLVEAFTPCPGSAGEFLSQTCVATAAAMSDTRMGFLEKSCNSVNLCKLSSRLQRNE